MKGYENGILSYSSSNISLTKRQKQGLILVKEEGFGVISGGCKDKECLSTRIGILCPRKD